MVLTYIWVGFFLLAFVLSLWKLLVLQDTAIFPALTEAIFEMAETAFEISLGLVGLMTLWLGIMRVGEKGGVIALFARGIGPLFGKLFPDLPRNHPAYGAMLMNLSANALGLDNAATPLGLNAMQELQKLNPKKETASNSMIMFLVLNTSGLTIVPVSIMVYRAEMGAADPSDIFVPILIATFCSTVAGIIITSLYQKISLLSPVILAYLGGLTLIVIGIIAGLMSMNPEDAKTAASVFGNFLLICIIIAFIGSAAFKRINVFEEFIEGAKEGFWVAVKIIPYLVGILVSIAAFRAAGGMELLMSGFTFFFELLNLDTRFVPGLPTAIMKPFSGSGARGMMVDAMGTYGADSFVGKMVSTIQGATDTTFYVIAVYFGSVGIRNTRYAVTCGIVADLIGIIAGTLVTYFFCSYVWATC